MISSTKFQTLLFLLHLASSSVIPHHKHRETPTTTLTKEAIPDVTTEGVPLETHVIVTINGERIRMSYAVKEPESTGYTRPLFDLVIVDEGNGEWDTLHGYKDKKIEYEYEDWHDWPTFAGMEG